MTTLLAQFLNRLMKEEKKEVFRYILDHWSTEEICQEMFMLDVYMDAIDDLILQEKNEKDEDQMVVGTIPIPKPDTRTWAHIYWRYYLLMGVHPTDHSREITFGEVVDRDGSRSIRLILHKNLDMIVI